MSNRVPWRSALILLIGVLWWYEETRYFGWNAHPESIAELLCDGSAMMIYVVSIFASVFESRSASRVSIKVDLTND